ncbi:MAG TPA: RNA polymerase sigma factor, partial [Phycisphaerales bacterium]|nr:RNA polymerase sigma factor [Phycisphaerales bacterium]
MSTLTLSCSLHACVGSPMIDSADSRPGGPPPHEPALAAATREEHWQAISRRLHRYALALCGESNEAEDLAQQTIATLLHRAPDLADHAGYARRTLTRLWIDRQRTFRRRFARMMNAAVESITPGPPAGHALELAERLDRTRRAIASLPPRQRAAITLRLVEGLDYPAIADAIGCEVASVRSNLHLARASLRRLVEP